MTEFSASATPSSSEIPDTPGLSQVERLVDVFVAPSKTFTDILRNQSWWLPFLISVIIGYGYLFAVQTQVGWDAVTVNVLKQDPKAAERMASAPPEQQAQTQKFTAAAIKYTFYATPLLVLATSAIAALILWATINFGFGGHATFGRVFAVWMYAAFPLIITSILTIVSLFAGLDKDNFNLNNPVGTNLGYFLGTDTAPWLMKLASSVDIVWLWVMFLAGIGLAIVAKVKQSSGLTAVFGWWILILLVKVVFAAVTG